MSGFSQWLRGFMEQRDLGREALAERVGVTPKTISEWLRGRGPMRPEETRERIERAFVLRAEEGPVVYRPSRRLSVPRDSEAAAIGAQLVTAVLSQYATAEETEYLLTKLTERVTALIAKRREAEERGGLS